jgi:hypothetical protein
MTWRIEYQDADGKWCLFNRATTEAAARKLASNAFLKTRYNSVRVVEVGK